MPLSQIIGGVPIIGTSVAIGTPTGFPLNTAYTHVTNPGASFGVRYMARSTDPIDAFWVFIHAVTGTPVLSCKIYNENTTLVLRPGATLRATATAVSTIAVGTWCKFTFGTPYTPVLGEILWFIVHNAAAGGTEAANYAEVRSVAGVSIPGISSFREVPYSTTTGWSTNGTVLFSSPRMIKQGSSYYGQPFTNASAAFFTNNTRERGIKFTCPASLKIFSAFWGYPNFNQANPWYTILSGCGSL